MLHPRSNHITSTHTPWYRSSPAVLSPTGRSAFSVLWKRQAASEQHHWPPQGPSMSPSTTARSLGKVPWSRWLSIAPPNLTTTWERQHQTFSPRNQWLLTTHFFFFFKLQNENIYLLQNYSSLGTLQSGQHFHTHTAWGHDWHRATWGLCPDGLFITVYSPSRSSSSSVGMLYSPEKKF